MAATMLSTNVIIISTIKILSQLASFNILSPRCYQLRYKKSNSPNSAAQKQRHEHKCH